MYRNTIGSILAKNKAVFLAVGAAVIYALLERFVYTEYNLRAFYILTMILSGIVYLGIFRYPIKYRYGLAARVLATLSIGIIVISTILSRDVFATILGNTHHGDGSLLLISLIVFCILVFKRLELDAAFFKKMYIFLVTIGVLSLALGLLDISTTHRLGGIFQQPILAAVYAGIPIVLGCYLFEYKHLSKKIFFISEAFLLAILLLTQTRASIIYIFVFLIFWGIKNREVLYGSKITKKTLSITLMVISIVVLAGIPAFIRTFNFDRFVYGLTFRAQLISYATSHSEYIPITGLGKDNATNLISYEEYQKYPELIRKAIVTDNVTIESVHNYFVDIWLQFGYLGLLAVVFAITLALVNYLSSKRTIDMRVAGALLLFMLVQLMVTHTYFVLQMLVLMSLFVLLRKPRSSVGKFSNWDIILTTIFLAIVLIVSYLQSLYIHTKILDKVAVFPLQINKREIAEGSSYNGQVLIWEPIEENYHHDYLAADIHVPEGSVVQASVAGQIVALHDVECDGDKNFPYIQIRGIDGFYYLYSHLKPQSIKHKLGDFVETADSLAQVGPSQCAQNSAPHLHFDISRFGFLPRNTWTDNYNFVDPQPMLSKKYQTLDE